MDTLHFALAQGSTPTLEIGLPLALDAENDVVFATFTQGFDTALEYALNGVPASPPEPPTGTLTVAQDDPCLLLLSMTQEDTLRLDTDDVLLQLRVKTGDGADTFLPLVGRVVKAEKGGTI